MTNISSAEMARKLSKEYDEASVEIFRDGHRNHLGASVIGEPCEALNWFQFRWIHNSNPGGRMYRLFQRGHREEPFVFQHLRKLDFVVNELDPTLGKQWRLSGIGGHFGGSCDGRGFLPESYGYAREVGFEVKTANDNQFKKLIKAGTVKTWKPKYARQMDIYGNAWELELFVFITINKNDDEKFIEFYSIEKIEAQRSLIKAERVIRAQSRPPRLSDHPSFAGCTYCDFKNHCHHGAKADINCRSCIHAEAVPDAQWYCNLHKSIIPRDVIVKGCSAWESII